jgi:kumamolisin
VVHRQLKSITWNDNGITSGGISTVTDSSGNLVFPLPWWQVGAGVPPSVNDGKTRGRGIPDIAGYANGYATIMFGTSARTWWGTSEAAPFYAALVAILNARLGYNLGYLNPLLYALAQTPG